MEREMRIIAAIDAAIDANRAELLRRHKVPNRHDARSWQDAWNAAPDLQERERALFRERGIAQLLRDIQSLPEPYRKRALADFTKQYGAA